MDIKDVYIPDQNYQGTEEELQHGRQWSEEAKERVRQARKAGRSVRDMFASYYNKQSRSVNKSLNKVANRTIYKKSISKARNKLVVAKSNRDLSYKRGVALKNSSSGFVSKGSTPVEKGRRAGIVAKLKRDNDVDKMVKDATVRYRKKELKKSSSHSTGQIAKDTTKVISKDVSKKVGKLSKTVDDINTNKGKGYKLTGKTKVSAKGGYERYASDAERGDVYGKRKVSVIKEGKRANSITDALTGKTNDYKEYSTKTEYKMWKERKKKSKSKPKSKKSNNPTIRQSGLNNVYIPGKTGTSDEILKR